MLELGSGPGLGGFLAAHWAKQVIVSDYQDLVMDLLNHNIKECNPRSDQCEMFTCKLDWCADKNLEMPLVDIRGEKLGQLKDSSLDVLIGTDVVYWPTMINPLVATLVSLFALNP